MNEIDGDLEKDVRQVSTSISNMSEAELADLPINLEYRVDVKQCAGRTLVRGI